MTTISTKNNGKTYPKRNGREMSTKEKRLFDKFEQRFESLLRLQKVEKPEILAYNLATLAIWEIQDYNPK